MREADKKVNYKEYKLHLAQNSHRHGVQTTSTTVIVPPYPSLFRFWSQPLPTYPTRTLWLRALWLTCWEVVLRNGVGWASPKSRECSSRIASREVTCGYINKEHQALGAGASSTCEIKIRASKTFSSVKPFIHNSLSLHERALITSSLHDITSKVHTNAN